MNVLNIFKNLEGEKVWLRESPDDGALAQLVEQTPTATEATLWGPFPRFLFIPWTIMIYYEILVFLNSNASTKSVMMWSNA